LILDLILLLIFALTLLISMRKGFMHILAMFLKGVASIVIAYFGAGPLGSLIENSSLGKASRLKIMDLLVSKWQGSDMYNALPGFFRETGAADSAIDSASTNINHTAWAVLSFIIIFLGIRIVVGILHKMVKSSREKEGFTGSVDWFLGLIMGILMGVFMVFLFLALLFPVSSVVAPGSVSQIMGWFDGSIFAQDLYDNNLLLLILSGAIA